MRFFMIQYRVAVLAVALGTGIFFARHAPADVLTQGFDAWSAGTGAGVHTNTDGWVIANTLTLNEGRPFPYTPISPTRAGYLSGPVASYVQTPLLPEGAGHISFWALAPSAGNNTLAIEYSPDGNGWTRLAEVTLTATETWQAFTNTQAPTDPVYIRILHTGTAGGIGLDDVVVIESPALAMSNAGHSPPAPTSEDSIHISVDVTDTHPRATNILIAARYRFDMSGPFASRPMTVVVPGQYQTESPIPAGRAGTLEYFIEANFDGLSYTSTTLPEDAPTNVLTATITNVSGGIPERRQLGPCTRLCPLTISEIMYHPPERQDVLDLEFIEVRNTDPMPFDLSGHRISGEIDYVFPDGTILPPQSYLVVAKDPEDIFLAYPVSYVLGPYEGRLSNGQGTIRLRNGMDAVLLEVEYDDNWPWPTQADGAGHSLVMSCPDWGEANRRAWSAGATIGGSPGMADVWPGDALSHVVINEILAHTDVISDFVELHNHGTQSVDISGCVLRDNLSTNQHVIANGTVLAPGGFAAFDTNELGFALSMAGADVFFVDTNDNRVIDAVRYPAQVNGVSSGRYPDGSPEWRVLASRTQGASNNGLYAQDVVINEIMYHPITGNEDEEYVEIHNLGGSPVDVSAWRVTDGISFVFPSNTTIAADGYLVIARNAALLVSNYTHLTFMNTLGDFGGNLSDRGERIVLSRPDDPELPNQDFVVVDTVEYTDGPRWGRWADGGGSSLELCDPRSDNRRAMNWTSSDESAKAPWTLVQWTGTLDNGRNAADELQILLFDEGECLVDDLEVFGSGGNRVPNGDFESGLGGWIIQGTHIGSELETAEGHTGSRSLKLRASGRGDNGVNRAEIDLTSAMTTGAEGTIRGWVRWQAGGPGILLRLHGNWLEAVGEMAVPANLGTPGQVNSRRKSNTGPAIFEVTHNPVTPAASEPITVTARIHDPDGIGSASLKYRVDPSPSVTSVTLADNGSGADAIAGDGVYSATIPGQSADVLVAFTVSATDAHGTPVDSQFPEESPDRECLVLFGQETPAGDFGVYRFLMTAATVQEWESRQKLSDHAVDGTFVYGDFRALYEGGGRYRGSPFIRPQYSSPETSYASVLLYVPKDERLLGSRAFNMDRLELDRTYQRERTALWMAGQIGLEHFRQRHVRLYINEHLKKNPDGSFKGTLYADVQQPNWTYVSSWYPDDDDGVLIKIDDWFEFNDNTQVGKEFNVNGRLENYTTGGAKKKARYRWSWAREQGNKAGFSDDYQSLFTAVDALNLDHTTTLYEKWVSQLIDSKQWMAEFAFRHVITDWDSYAYNRGKNTSTYRPQRGRWSMHMWDLDRDHLGGNAYDDNLLKKIEDPVMKNKFFANPRFLRIYWGAVHALCYGPMEPAACHPLLDDTYAAFVANGEELVEDPDVTLKPWIATRRAFLTAMTDPTKDCLPTVEADFVITSNGGNDISTGQSPLTIEGTVPVSVQALRLNGEEYFVSYASVTNWSMRVGLSPSVNTLVIEGEDWYGNVITSDTIRVTYTGTPPSPGGQLVISEIMYHPALGGVEFVEIHNISTNEYDLGGWRINGLDFTFPHGTFIAPGGFVVAAENVPNYAETYTDASAILALAGDANGSLDNGGETLQLLMPEGSNSWSVIDEVRFDDDAPWPAEAKGTGYSLQLIDAAQDNNRIGNWRTSQGLPQPAAMSTPGAPNNTAEVLPKFPAIWISEIMPSNTITLMDNADEFEPWIELFNADGTPVDLGAGYYLTDDPTNLTKWAFTAGQTITNNGYLLVYADGESHETTNGFPHTDWRMNSVSGVVVLAKDNAGDILVIDVLSYGLIDPDSSYGSYPEGQAGNCQVFHFPTPGSANSPTSQPVCVRINEWMADNVSFVADPADGKLDDWFELYNCGNATANLGGFSLTDDLAETNRFVIPGGTLVPPNGYLLVWADKDVDQNTAGGALHVSFNLSKNGEIIALFAPDGGLVDVVSFGAQLPNASEGCWPDGSEAVHAMLPPTPGTSNRTLAITTLSFDGPANAVTWNAESGKVYVLSQRDSLVTGTWHQVGVVTAVSATATLTDTNAPRPVRFYRILQSSE